MRGRISEQNKNSVHDVHDVHDYPLFKSRVCGNTLFNKEKNVDNLDIMDMPCKVNCNECQDFQKVDGKWTCIKGKWESD